MREESLIAASCQGVIPMTLSFASTSELLKNRDMDTDADTPQGMGLLPPRRLSAAACLPLSSTVILHGIASAHAPVMSTVGMHMPIRYCDTSG